MIFMPPLLETEDISRAYGPFRALAPTSLVLESGDLVVLAGPNGAGKSTLLLCLSGLLRPSTGVVRVEGSTCTGMRRMPSRAWPTCRMCRASTQN